MPLLEGVSPVRNIGQILLMIARPLAALILIGCIGAGGYFGAKVFAIVEMTDVAQTVSLLEAPRLNVDALQRMTTDKSVPSAYHDLVVHLKGVRRLLPDARSVFIIKRTNPKTWQYVAATNSFDAKELLDQNGNGVIDPAEEAPVVGTPYHGHGIPAFLSGAFLTGNADEAVHAEETGGLLTIYAALRNDKGVTTAALGIDMVDPVSSEPFMMAIVIAGIGLAWGMTLTVSLSRLLRKTVGQNAEQMDEERLALLELATHQLGAPLATFRWWLELLKDPDTATVDPKSVIEQVEAGVKRLDGIVNALSNATKVQLKEVKLQNDVLGSLKYLVLRAVQEATPELKTHCLKVTTQIDTMEPVKVDGMQAFGIIKELLSNAIAYSPPNKDITIKVSKKANMCQLEVIDHGYGIPAAEQSRIFEQFFRASNAAKYKPVGNGMGLYNVKGIVDKSGGKIWFESREGKGTTMYCSFPLVAKKEWQEK